jgi:Domain of unknown function (DUF2341)
MNVRRLTWSLVLFTSLVMSGCAAGTGIDDGGDDGGSGGSTNVPTGLAAYAFRAPLTLETAGEDVTARVTIDHAALVAAGSSLADGSDVRLVFANDAGEFVELNRVLDRTSKWDSTTTRIFFRTQPAGANAGTYYLYYGNAAPEAEVADPTAVFDLWDDFDILEEAWQVAEIGAATDGGATLENGSVRLLGKSQDIGGMLDDMVLLHRSISGDFRIDVSLASAGGSLGGSAKTGGLMVRATLDADSPHMTITRQREATPPSRRVSLSRDTAGGPTETNQVDAPETYPLFMRVQRVAGSVTASYSEDGVSFIALGPGVNLGTVDPVFVGIPLANISGGVGEVDTDWFRLTKPTVPDPQVSIGAEETL